MMMYCFTSVLLLVHIHIKVGHIFTRTTNYIKNFLRWIELTLIRNYIFEKWSWNLVSKCILKYFKNRLIENMLFLHKKIIIEINLQRPAKVASMKTRTRKAEFSIIVQLVVFCWCRRKMLWPCCLALPFMQIPGHMTVR